MGWMWFDHSKSGRPVLATALGKIPIQVVAKPLRDFGLGSHEIPDAVIFGG